jgi:hypothetical protein
VALTGEMVNLSRLNIGKNPPERRAVGKISIMQEEPFSAR